MCIRDRTEIAPLMIMSKLQEFDYASATSIALVMLAAAFVILFILSLIHILRGHAIIITVKTPQYIIYSFCYTP